MARTRLLHPEFFRHDELAQLPALHRLLFQGTWTIADREGRLEDRPARIKAEVLPYDNVDVAQMLNDLVAAGFLVRYQVGGRPYLAIPSWRKWQQPHIKEKPSDIPAPEQAPDKHGAQPGDPGTSPPVSVSVSDPVSVSGGEAARERATPPAPEVKRMVETSPGVFEPRTVDGLTLHPGGRPPPKAIVPTPAVVAYQAGLAANGFGAQFYGEDIRLADEQLQRLGGDFALAESLAAAERYRATKHRQPTVSYLLGVLQKAIPPTSAPNPRLERTIAEDWFRYLSPEQDAEFRRRRQEIRPDLELADPPNAWPNDPKIAELVREFQALVRQQLTEPRTAAGGGA